MIAATLVALAALYVLYRRGGARNILFVAGAFFFLFAFGPVLSVIFDLSYYSGIVLENVPASAWGFALALVALALVDLLMPQIAVGVDDQPSRAVNQQLPFLPLAYVAFTLYVVAFVLVAGIHMVGAGKLEQVESAGPFHPYVLLLGMVLVASYFLTERGTIVRGLWMGVLVTYVIYNLLTSERDFLLMLASVGVHRLIMEPKLLARFSGLAMGLLGVGAALLATFLFSLRNGGSSGLSAADVLNQGSILFIDSVVRGWIPDGLPYQQGTTYLGAVLSIVPSFLLESDHTPLPVWFLNLYAPGSRFGYGYSLSAEAYMNFGDAGVPLVFAVLALFHRWVVNQVTRSAAWTTFSCFSLSVLMYAFRGDFNQYFKSLVFGLVILVVLTTVGRRRQPLDQSQRGAAARRRRRRMAGVTGR